MKHARKTEQIHNAELAAKFVGREKEGEEENQGIPLEIASATSLISYSK